MRRAILVTGSARSGTTWVGTSLAHGPRVAFVSEPFNVHHPPCACGFRLEHRYTYISDADAPTVQAHLAHVLARFSRLEATNAIRRSAKEHRPRYVRRLWAHLRAERVLLKAPMALFSAEWLAETFDMQVVVMLRHPAAVANSYRELGWTHPFSDFLAQPRLMEEHLSRFAPMIERFARTEQDPLDQAALLWTLVYHVVLGYRDRHADDPRWTFARHEELAAEPTESFERLYGRLGLPFDERARRFVSGTISPDPGTPDDPYAIRRDPNIASGRWRSRFSRSEQARIRRIVGSVGEALYPEASW